MTYIGIIPLKVLGMVFSLQIQALMVCIRSEVHDRIIAPLFEVGLLLILWGT